MSNGTRADQGSAPARRWSFGPAVLDERTRELFVGGAAVAVERKPLEVLIYLLHRAGEVVTKDELFNGVWPGRIVTEQVLTRCVGKLREALGDDEQAIIKTAHGYGYRLAVAVQVDTGSAPAPPQLGFKPGDRAPLRPNWRLEECLGTGGHGEVWRARHTKTHEQRVYKFALEDSCLPSLKREITVSRLLHDSLGARGAAFVRVLEWNLDERPYFIECEFATGGNLVTWAEARGGLDKVGLAQRIDIVIQVAEALAAAHSLDVLHKDLKPSNVLIEQDGDSAVRVRLCDFGSGGVLQPQRLSELGITQMGFTRTLNTDSSTSGTPLYFPPEVVSGQPFTKQSDVFSLGVILYQLIVGDLRRPLAPGWEEDIEDAQLREDIALAAAGNPQRRLRTAEELVARLKARDERGAAGRSTVSIAILPFVNRGEEADADFAESMTEELITGFSKLEGVLVASLKAVSAYKDRQEHLAAMGKALKVHCVLAGEVAKDSGKLRVKARLVRVATGGALWSQEYDRSEDDLFALQEELAVAVAGALKLTLPRKAKLVNAGTQSLPAYRIFMRAKQSWIVHDEALNRQSMADLQRATEIDPRFARAHAEQTKACWSRVYWIAPDDQASLKLGFAAAERALSIDPTLAEAHFARGQLAFTPASRFAYGMAIKEFKRALALNGKLSAAWSQLVGVYTHVGLLDEADRLSRKALEIDPHDGSSNFQDATIPIWRGRYEEGLDRIEALPRDLYPVIWYWHTIWALTSLERWNEAEARVDEYFRHHADKAGLITSARAKLHALAGRHEESLADIKTAAAVDRRFGHFHHTAYEIASAYALMKQRKEALEYLHEAVTTGFPCCAIIDRDPFLANLKGDPGLEKVLHAPRHQCEHYRAMAADQNP